MSGDAETLPVEPSWRWFSFIVGFWAGLGAMGLIAAHADLLGARACEIENRRLLLVIACQNYSLSQAGDLLALLKWKDSQKLYVERAGNRGACEELKKIEAGVPR